MCILDHDSHPGIKCGNFTKTLFHFNGFSAGVSTDCDCRHSVECYKLIVIGLRREGGFLERLLKIHDRCQIERDRFHE